MKDLIEKRQYHYFKDGCKRDLEVVITEDGGEYLGYELGEDGDSPNTIYQLIYDLLWKETLEDHFASRVFLELDEDNIPQYLFITNY